MLLSEIQDILRQNGFAQFSRPYELNIIGIRSDAVQADRFDDFITVHFRQPDGNWRLYSYAATTDPGTYWLENPLNPQGTAILKEGQYLNSYCLGLHRGIYKALVQQNPVTVMRDYDRNAVLDFANGTAFTGMFGINIHRATQSGTTRYVDRHSAGCQVFADASDFEQFLLLCERHRQLYGNVFTYTLLDQRAVTRDIKKNCCWGLAS